MRHTGPWRERRLCLLWVKGRARKAQHLRQELVVRKRLLAAARGVGRLGQLALVVDLCLLQHLQRAKGGRL